MECGEQDSDDSLETVGQSKSQDSGNAADTRVTRVPKHGACNARTETRCVPTVQKAVVRAGRKTRLRVPHRLVD
jgi:hypothetical protein